jgi:hypothetical protein
LHNDPTQLHRPPPMQTVTSGTTVIYSPPTDGFPFVAAVFNPTGKLEAFRPFASRRDAEAFLQAFMQEGAGEYGLNEHGQRETTWMGGGS